MDCFPSSCNCNQSSVAISNSKVHFKKVNGGIRKGKARVKLSTDAQSIAARERRHRISERFKILQSLVPGGSKMDTVSMLDEAIHYVKFLKTQIWLHHNMINFVDAHHHPNFYLPASKQTTSSHLYAQINRGGEPLHDTFPHSAASPSEESTMANFNATMLY